MDGTAHFRGGTWQRYKLGQAQFTKWLKQTAEKLTPDPSSTATTATATTSSFSSAGAAKKAKKKAEKSGIDTATSVHWRELEVLASNIVDNAKPEDIPSAPINILRDVIGLRKKSAAFFGRADGDEEMKERNATHEHIIKVLERVLAKFEAVLAKVPGGAKRDAASSSRSSTKMDLADLNNMFEHLEVQTSAEAGEEDEDRTSDKENRAESITSSKKPKKGGKKKAPKGGKASKKQRSEESSSKTKKESSWVDSIDFGLDGLDDYDDDEEFDYYMMVYCFFEDFNLIRDYICERWCDYYYDRSIGLNALAVMTNAAFELFQQMEHDLLSDMRRSGIANYRQMGDYETMMMMVFTEFGMEHIDYDSYEDLSEEEEQNRMWKDEWEWLASPAFSTVRKILEMIPIGKTPMIRPEDRSRPDYGGSTVSELSKFKDVVINDLVFDVVIVKAMKKMGQVGPILPAESELMLGFQDSLKNHDLSSAFIFSLQLYIDIRHILEDQVSDPFEEMIKTAQLADQDLAVHSCRATGPRRELKRIMRNRQKEFQRVMLHDVLMEDKEPRYKNAGIKNIEPFFLLKHEPIWAGLLDFRAKLVLNEIGHEMVTRSFSVEAAAYIYAAARAASSRFPEHDEIPAWPDMDMFIASYEDSSPFRAGFSGLASKDPTVILRNFGLICPKDVTMPPNASVPIDGIKGQTEDFKRAIRIRETMWRRYASEETRKYQSGSADYMQEILDHLYHDVVENPERPAFTSFLKATAILARFAEEPDSSGKGGRKVKDDIGVKMARERFLALFQISPITVLDSLGKTVDLQLAPLLSIDYLDLHAISGLLLQSIFESSEESFKSRVGYVKGEPLPDRLVNVPLLLGEDLTGDPAKGEAVLRLLVKETKSCVAIALKPKPTPEAEELSEDEWSSDSTTSS